MSDHDILPLHTFESIAADNRTASPETLAALLRGVHPPKFTATCHRRHARIVVQRRIRGTA